MTNRIEKILITAIRNNDYSNFKDLLSLEDRKFILYEADKEFIGNIPFFTTSIYSNLFTSEEAEAIFVNETNRRAKYRLLLSCSDEFKLNELADYDGIINRLLASFSDDNKRLEAFNYFLENDKISSYSIGSCIGTFNLKMGSELVDIIVNCFLNKSNFELNLYTISDVISNLDNTYREEAFYKMLNALVASSSYIDNFGFNLVIECFSKEKQIDIFRSFVELHKNGKMEIPSFLLSSLLEKVDDDIKIDFINCFLENGFLNQSFLLPEIFERLSDDDKDKVLQIFYNHEEEIDVLLVTDFVISRILLKYSSDKFLYKFKNIVINDEARFDSFSVASEFKDMNIRFSALNLIVKEKVNSADNIDKDNFFVDLREAIDSYEDKFPSGDILYNDLLDFYVDNLGLNRENFYDFIRIFGYLSLKYLESYNVLRIINMDRVEFKKLMKIFKSSNLELNNDSLNTAIHAILQREYRFKCSDEYNIYSKLDKLISNSKFEEAERLLLSIFSEVSVNKILNKYNISLDLFLSNLFSGDSKMFDILNEITSQYISCRREKYIRNRSINIKDELKLTKKYEKNFIKKKYLATTSLEDISFSIRLELSDVGLNKKQIELKNNRDLIDKIIKFKKNPSNYVLDNEISSNLKLFESLLDAMYDKNMLKDPTNDKNAKYVYYSEKVSDESLLELVSNLNVDIINEHLFGNELLFDELCAFLDKYRLLSWGDTFDTLLESADLEFNNNTLSGIINYFYKIYPDINKDNKLTKLIALSNCYVSDSSKYRLLFGTKPYNLIVANEGKNKATMLKYKRLNYGVDHVIGMYKRDKMPVPTMDIDVKLEDGRKINVVVGNATNMDNLVLGELTNSCLRIGGAFYDLFTECLEGEFGFHIVFLEPVTEKFITRVSGVRNGNTLFLNELRDSECSDYDNEECVDVIREVSKILVNESKHSEFPIDNVVITSDCAMIDHDYELENLHLPNRYTALLGLCHNLNKQGTAIVLASSKEDNSLVDVKLGVDSISYYLPQRDKVRIYEGKDAVEKVIQLKYLLNGILNDEGLENITVSNDIDVIKCIAGSDWYISVDSKGNIDKFILENSFDKDRAMEEMNNYLNEFGYEVENGKRGVVR